MSETEKSIDYGLAFKKVDNEPKASISFRLNLSAHILLHIFRADQEVRLLLNEWLTIGTHHVDFDFGNLGPGEYLIKLMVNMQNTLDIETQLIYISE
jgi:hypothetical protein